MDKLAKSTKKKKYPTLFFRTLKKKKESIFYSLLTRILKKKDGFMGTFIAFFKKSSDKVQVEPKVLGFDDKNSFV